MKAGLPAAAAWLEVSLGLVWLELDEPVFRRWREALKRYGISIEQD